MNAPGTAVPTWLRVLRFPLLRLLLAFLWIALVSGATQKLFAILPGSQTAAARLAGAAGTALVALLAYAGFVRLVERRAVRELAPQGALAEAAGGVALGVALFAGTIGIIAAAGAYRVEGASPWVVALPVLGMAIVSGVVEELLLRAVVFRVLEEMLGTWLALAVSALLFGALHLANPHASPIAALGLALEAGVLLAAAYIATRRLWLAMGLHFGWNFTQGGVFGVAVSGHATTGVWRGALSGPAWLSGGEFGAEASVVAVALCLLAGVALLAVGLRRGHLVGAPWRHGPGAGAPPARA